MPHDVTIDISLMGELIECLKSLKERGEKHKNQESCDGSVNISVSNHWSRFEGMGVGVPSGQQWLCLCLWFGFQLQNYVEFVFEPSII